MIAIITSRLVAAGFVTTGLIAARLALLLLWRLLATRRLDAAEGAAKFLDLAFIGELLALGDFDKFQNFVEMINHLLERLGNLRGMLDGLGNGRGFGRPKISGLDPRLGALRFGTALLTAVVRATIAKLFARRLGRADRFRFGRCGIFRSRFRLVVMLNVFRLMRSKFGGRFRVGFAEAAGRVSFVFRVLIVVPMIGGFDGRRGGFHRFRCGRNFVSGRRFAGFRRGTGATAAATSTPTTAPAVAGVPGGGGRV